MGLCRGYTYEDAGAPNKIQCIHASVTIACEIAGGTCTLKAIGIGVVRGREWSVIKLLKGGTIDTEND